MVVFTEFCSNLLPWRFCCTCFHLTRAYFFTSKVKPQALEANHHPKKRMLVPFWMMIKPLTITYKKNGETHHIPMVATFPWTYQGNPTGKTVKSSRLHTTRTVEGLGVGVLHQRILCSRSRTCRFENLWSSFGHARCVCVCFLGVFLWADICVGFKTDICIYIYIIEI